MTDTDRQQPGQRKRGVRASRTKLVHALTEAGFRTQAALAEHLADLESLDSAPKDLVNRAFRELPVDPQTLDRIATALDVEAYTLYKSTHGEPPSANQQATPEATVKPAPTEPGSSAGQPAVTTGFDEPEHVSARPSRMVTLLGVVSVLAILAAIWFYQLSRHPRSSDVMTATESNRQQPASTALSLGPRSVVVLPFANDESDLAQTLRQTLTGRFKVATSTATAAAQTSNPQELASKLRVDGVLTGEFKRVGSETGLRVFHHTQAGRQLLWAESLPARQAINRVDKVAEHIAVALVAQIDSSNVPFFPLVQVQDEYLQGRFYLEQPTSELNIKRAQSRFSSAVRQQPGYAKAHAGLCMALLEEFWMDDEERAMDDAARTCGEAVSLAPDDNFVGVAHAYFLRRSGQIDESITTFQAIVDREPDNALALEGLASALLDSYRQSGEENKLEQAITVANRSVTANPDAWRPYNTLLSLNWFAGDIAGAIDAAERSLTFEQSELVLVNLGTMYLCTGALEKARSTYQQAIELAPGSYFGIEFLGQAMYFLGDFERSAELRQTAIESIAEGAPEIHEMWGNLGDSFRQTGDTAGAIGAYLQASRIAERDHIRGNAAIADRASRAYYFTMLRLLDRDTVSDEVYATMRSELDDIDASVTETSALRRLAQTWLALGETEKARRILQKVTKTCPGYGLMPDLVSLNERSTD